MAATAVLTAAAGVATAASYAPAPAHQATNLTAKSHASLGPQRSPRLDDSVAIAPPRPGVAAPAPSPAVVSPTAAAVAPLSALHSPDALVTVPQSLLRQQLAALAKLPGVTATNPVDAGTVTVAGAPVTTLGVDPSRFRAFTAAPTAGSDALWQSVAGGELVTSFQLRDARRLTLGAPTAVAGATPTTLRVGGVADTGLPGVQAIVDHTTATRLGLAPATGVVVSAPQADPQRLASELSHLLGPQARVFLLHPPAAPVARPARTVATGKPRTYQELYRAAAVTCPGLSWSILAGIGQVESDHGRNAGPSSAGALGPMQFLPSTFVQVAVDGDGDGKANILDPYDAVYSAAKLLCEDGAGRGGQSLHDAIFDYNHAEWYVQEVLGLAGKYEATYGG